MTRPVILIVALSLAACGATDLKSISNKQLTALGDVSPDGGASYSLMLLSDGCPTFDQATQVQLDGQPMKLVAAGSRAVFDENKCDHAQWDFHGAQPKGDLHFTLHDDSDELSMTVHDPTDVPQVSAASTTLTRGQTVSTDPAQPPGDFSGFELIASDGTTVQLEDARNGLVTVPSTFPAGPAQLVPEFQVVPHVDVTGDATGFAAINVVGAPIAVTIQ